MHYSSLCLYAYPMATFERWFSSYHGLKGWVLVIMLAQQVLLPAEPSWWLSCIGLFNGLVVVLVECPLSSAMLGTACGCMWNLRKHGVLAMYSMDSTPVSIQNSFVLYMQHIHRLRINLHIFSNCVYKASFHDVKFSQLMSVFKSFGVEAGQWWCIPLTPAFRRRRQEDFRVWGQSHLQSEFQDTHGYTVKACLRK